MVELLTGYQMCLTLATLTDSPVSLFLYTYLPIYLVYSYIPQVDFQKALQNTSLNL